MQIRDADIGPEQPSPSPEAVVFRTLLVPVDVAHFETAKTAIERAVAIAHASHRTTRTEHRECRTIVAAFEPRRKVVMVGRCDPTTIRSAPMTRAVERETGAAEEAMPSRQGHTALSPTLGVVLHRIALTALAQASLVLVACMIAGSLGGRGVETYLRSAVLAFSLVGSVALGRGIRAERSLAHNQAGNFYALAFVNNFVAYASVVAHHLLERTGGS